MPTELIAFLFCAALVGLGFVAGIPIGQVWNAEAMQRQAVAHGCATFSPDEKGLNFSWNTK